MKTMGRLDHVVRLGAVAAAIGADGLGLIGGTFDLVIGVVAVVLLLTRLTATCPDFMPVGLATWPRHR